jgi:hypothetical protein
MTVTVEVINEKTIDMLNVMESMGLIHVQPPIQQETEKLAREGRRTLLEMYGIHAGRHGRTVDDFLRECHEEKERENAIDKRREEERERMRANAKLPS